jgi:hypothetical protein
MASLGWKTLGKVQRKGNLMTGEYEQVIICVHKNSKMKHIHSKMGEKGGMVRRSRGSERGESTFCAPLIIAQ